MAKNKFGTPSCRQDIPSADVGDDFQNQYDLSIREAVEAGLNAGANALMQGEIDRAIELFSTLITTAPNNPDVHNALGVALANKGDNDGAEQSLRKAVKLAPDHADFHRNLGSILSNQQRFTRAMRAFRKSLALDPKNPETIYKVAMLHRAQGSLLDYENKLKEVISIDPRHYEANNDLGCHFITTHKFKEAVNCLEIACRSTQAKAGTLFNLANAYSLLGDLPQAKKTFSKAVELEPDNIGCLMGLAVCERNLGQLEQALRHIEAAVLLDSDNGPVYNARGTIFRELGKFDRAFEDFTGALEKDNKFAPAQVNRGLLHLLHDDWSQGFADLESRWSVPHYSGQPRNATSMPAVGQDLTDGSIFLFSEQGYGDAIQFVRFSGKLLENGMNVVLKVPKDLKTLMQTSMPTMSVIDDEDPLPECDWQSPLMSLPYLMGITSFKSISGDPYLVASPIPEEASGFLSSDKCLTVGVNWVGARGHKEDYKRSIDPELFEALGSVKGIQFFDLQFDVLEERPYFLNSAPRLADFASNFYESASVLKSLDLVISVDTSTLHLAGALGVPCWGLIPKVPDWRWRLEGETTPWYNSVRLFRQSNQNEWSDVLNRLASRLEDMRGDNT